MIDLPVFRSSPNHPATRRRPRGDRHKPGVEQLERRELLDTGLGSAVGLTGSVSSRLVNGLYNDLLNRAPQPAEVPGWQNALEAGQGLGNLARAVLSSPEYQTDFISSTYTTVLKREPQIFEVNGWLRAVQAGLGEEGLTAQFLASDEYYQEHGGTPEGWLTGLYSDLFQRGPDAAGFFLWKNELQSGTSRETVASAFVTSPEANTRFVAASYQHFLDRAPDAAGEAAWVNALDGGLPRSALIAGIMDSPEYASLHTAGSAREGSPLAAGSSVQFQFGPAWSSAAQGQVGVSLADYSPEHGYGWEDLSGLVVQDRGGIVGVDNTFRVDLPDGAYTVTVTLGDAIAAHSNMSIWAQGTQEVSGLSTAPGQFIQPTFNVQVTNGELRLRFAAQGAGNTFILDSLSIAPAANQTASTGTEQTTNDGTGVPSQGMDTSADVLSSTQTPVTPTATATSDASAASATSALIQTNQDNSVSNADAAAVTSGSIKELSRLSLTATINGAPTSSAVNVPITLTSTVKDTNHGAVAAGFRYAWRAILNDVTTATATTPNFTFTPKTVGTYTVRLTVTDIYNFSVVKSKTITVTSSLSNTLSVAIKGAPTSSSVGTSISLTSTVSPMATPLTSTSTASETTSSYSYNWNVTKNGAAFASATTQNFSFTPNAAGSYVVTLTATAKDGTTGKASQTISVSSPVTTTLTAAINGAPASSPEGTAISLTSTVTASSTLMAAGFTYSWTVTKNGAAFASATTPNFSFTPTEHATYVVTLVATASDKTTATASKTITVTDVSPLVSINGAPATGTTGSAIALTSTVFSPSTADTAAGFTYAWSVTKNNAAFASASTKNFSFTPNTAATYVVTLTVKDSDGATGTASKSITVTTTSSQPPSSPPPSTQPPGPSVGAFITTPYDKIPNYGANPDVVSATSGPWSSPSTWSTGSVPGAGDVVSINANTTVTYDLVSDAAVNTVIVQSGGHLVFRTDVSTRLTVVNLIVLEGGELQIGTAGNPVPAGVKAEVVFANQALDTAFDPAQYGNGLIALGKVTMYGAAKSDTFVKLAAEPKAGDTTLTLSQPVTGWQAGDKLILPDTRQLIVITQTDQNYAEQMERPAIASVSSDGRTITLSSPLQFDHLGARDGNGALTFLPYVGNLSRNVMVRSQSATGTRGHATFTYHADVDIRYVGFYGLGRTQEAALDNTTFDASGNATHIGTNQSGRYPVYFNHLVGPSSVPSDGYQYTFTGNAIFCPLDPMPFRWGLALNDSHYGLIQDNVLDNWAGAGIVTESGNESYNVIAHNFVVDVTNQNGSVGLVWERADSRGLKDLASEGVGFWFRGFNNYVRDNVAADCGSYGYTYFAQYVGSVKVPLAPGNDTITAGQYQTVDMNGTPILEFSGNEAFGATPSGMTVWWLATMFHTPRDQTPISIVKDFHVWHVHQQGFFGYEMNRVTFDGLVVRGDFGLLAQNQTGNQGFSANDYFLKDIVVQNADIQGMWIGFEPSTDSGSGTQTIQNSYLRNYFNVYLKHLWTSAYRSDIIPPRVTNVRNCTFAAPNVPDFSYPKGPKQNIYMDDVLPNGAVNLIQSDQLFVYDYNGVAGDNFQVYYLGQGSSSSVPQTTLNSDGTPLVDAAPQGGLTNQQAWAKYGIAIAGAVAPTNTTRADITGLVRAI